MQFKTDLTLGQYYENKYIEKRKFKNIHYPKDSKFPDYDFKNLGNDKSYEIKSDRMTKVTGNIFIEYECNGKPSGINATKADVLIYFVCNVDNNFESEYFYRIDIEELKDKINNNEYSRKVVQCGDLGKVKGYLFSESNFTKYKKFYEIQI